MNVIVVHGTVAHLRNRVIPLVCGQVGFDKIRFDVDAEWEGMPLTAQFSYGADVVNVVVDNGYAVVPTLPIGAVSVRLRGDGSNGVIATANEIVLPVVRGFEDGGTPSVPPDPDLYNELLSQVEEAAKSAYPKGGLKGQVLTKMSDADKDFEWSDVGGTGTAGGYYTPEVTQPSDGTMQVSFAASEDNMPPVEPVSVTLPAGPAGKDGEDGAPGLPGQDGYSPTVQTESTEGGTRVTITDATGPKEFEILNGRNGQDGQPGQDGTPGQDGFSPTASVTQTADGAQITITDKSGTTNATITNGKDGTNGTDGQDGVQLNDNAVNTTEAWSSRMIVDSLAPAFSETGAVVTCTPVAGYPLHVVSQITPVQDGEGDPTPDNVRPIVGWSRSNLWVGGKNLLSLLDYTNIANGPIVNENEIIFSKSIGAVEYVFQNMIPGQYTVSLKRSGYSGIEVIVGGKTVISNGGKMIYKGTFTVAMNEAVTILFGEGQNPSGEQRIISDVMLTFGDHVEYERYKQGSDFKSMSFGQTVYGGTLDWTTGVLTVTQAEIASYNGEVLPGAWISDRDVYNPGTTPTIGAQVVYELPEPQSIQLTPQEILALSGTNTIYADTGDVTVSGRADPNAVIQQLAARIAALESAAVANA